MSDGCWVQFWDDKNCTGATLRFDEDTGTGARLVANLDDYTQSDGSKEGNEPDSLATGTRTWLIVYKDDDFDGKSASFGPNTRIDNLDDYGVGGNISSFKIYDYKPAGFVETTTGSPIAVEDGGDAIDASTVNNFFRTAVGAALTLIPGVGSGLSILVRGLWPDVNNRDQVWGAFQNYLNQAIAGVYWQTTYDYLNNELEALFNAAKDFAETPEVDHTDKASRFENLYNLVNNDVPFFIDEAMPETRFSFLAPFATLRLATLQENLRNYAYYYGSEPSAEQKERLTTEIKDSITLYTKLMTDARDRILARRDQMIFTDGGYLIDLYNGRRQPLSDPDGLDSRRGYAENVWNKLALKLDQHVAVSQLWPHFDPDDTSPVEPPVLTWVDGPIGYYWYDVPDFRQVIEDDQRITRVDLWTYEDGPNPEQQNGLELYIDGVGQGRVGGAGGRQTTMELTSGETVVQVDGASSLRYLRFFSDTGKQVVAGDPYYGVDFTWAPLPDTTNGQLLGVSGSAGKSPDEPDAFASVRALATHWRCELPFDEESLPEQVTSPRRRKVAEAV